MAYATGQLRELAKAWWDVRKSSMTPEAVKALTWEEFRTPFLEHHRPAAAVNKIKEEFMHMRHNGETIDQITGLFLDKLKFCGNLAQTEAEKVYYYHNMLGAEYREFLVPPTKFATLNEIINAARDRESELNKQIARGERRALDANPNPPKKQKIVESPKKTGNKAGTASLCTICGKGHRGECIFKNKPCPLCAKLGHVVSNCPN